MTNNDDTSPRDSVDALLIQLIGYAAISQPDADSNALKDMTKRFIQATLDNGYTSPSLAPTTPERNVWELADLLGYGPGFDPFALFADLVPMIDQLEYDLFND